MNNKLPQLAMIARLTQTCELDKRVEAAKLQGSFAAGESDKYSDIDDGSLAEIDQESWLNQIEPVEFCNLNEFDITAVVINNLVRGEFHFDSIGEMAKFEEFQGTVWCPSLESTILVDKTENLTTQVEKLIGSPSHRATPDEAQNLCNSFINWYLFGINVFVRGEFSRAHEILHVVHDVLFRVMRLEDGKDEHWITPTKSLEVEILPEICRRFLKCTFAADSDSLVRAYQACIDLVRDLMEEIRIQFHLELPGELIERLAERFSGQVSLKNQQILIHNRDRCITNYRNVNDF